MAPLIPRFHLWEIDDQPWFPSWFRGRVQAALTRVWTFTLFPGRTLSPSHIVAKVITEHISDLSSWVMIDFCAGGGGPTPSIEKVINRDRRSGTAKGGGGGGGGEPVQFVLTDLHPHTENWSKAAARSPNIHFEPDPVDASAAAQTMIDKYAATGPTRKKVFRMFHLSFHHFDDPLAKAILKNTVETSDGFGIFELQDRSIPAFFAPCLFGIGIMISAPYYAWKWRSPMTLFWTYIIPVLPFVLVFDGWISCLRSRTPEEVEVLLRTCGASGTERWEIQSGSTVHLWPCAYVNWIVCVKKDA